MKFVGKQSTNSPRGRRAPSLRGFPAVDTSRWGMARGNGAIWLAAAADDDDVRKERGFRCEEEPFSRGAAVARRSLNNFMFNQSGRGDEKESKGI